MTEQNSEKENKDQKDQDSASTGSGKAVRRVVVTHLDEPPPSGKTRIHPRRPSPIVPTREERTGEHPEEDTKGDQSGSE